jgi:integrase
VNPAALIPVTQPGDLRQDRVGQLIKRVLDGVASDETHRAYGHALEMFLAFCGREGNPTLSAELVDITGKGNRVRSVAIPAWVKAAIDAWTSAAGIREGKVFRAVRKGGKVWGEDLTPGAVLQIVQHYARAMGLEKLAPHDMRRTCAKLCRKRGGDLEQIKFLLGHASIQTTERYLGAEQDFISAVNDNLGLEK